MAVRDPAAIEAVDGAALAVSNTAALLKDVQGELHLERKGIRGCCLCLGQITYLLLRVSFQLKV